MLFGQFGCYSRLRFMPKNSFFAVTSICIDYCEKEHLSLYVTSKRIKLGSPSCSGFEANLKSFKTDQQGFPGSIHLAVVHMNTSNFSLAVYGKNLQMFNIVF